MGTNYYFEKKPPCKECNRPFPMIHIGKSSYGWHFALRIYPEMRIDTLEDWKNIWRRSGRIFDEDGKEISYQEMEKKITEREYSSNEEDFRTESFLKENSAKKGFNGLLMHDSKFVIGNEGGTWDLLLGEFS